MTQNGKAVSSEAWWPAFVANSRLVQLQPGETLFATEEAFNSVAFVQSGLAAAFSYSEEGQETWVCQFEAGQLIGTSRMFGSYEAPYEVQAVETLDVWLISPSAFESLLQSEHRFLQFVWQDLSSRLQISWSDLVQMHTLSVKGRICAELLTMAREMGVDVNKCVIRPTPVFVDMARRLNSTRETVSRTVAELCKKGVIERSPGALIINSPERLDRAFR